MSRRANDVGGTMPQARIDRHEHDRADWETLTDAVRLALGAKGLVRMDEIRRATEDLGHERYHAMGYYERRVSALQHVIVEKSLLTEPDIERRMQELRGTAPS